MGDGVFVAPGDGFGVAVGTGNGSVFCGSAGFVQTSPLASVARTIEQFAGSSVEVPPPERYG